MPTLHIVIPCYNEQPTLEACLQRVMAAPLPVCTSGEPWQRAIILIDDHSRDGTRSLAESLIERITSDGTRAALLHHEVNRGKGAAVRTGFDAVLKDPRLNEDDLIIIQDADLEYDPNDYAALMQPIINGEAEVVYGTRWGNHRPVTGMWRRLHAFGNRTLTRLSNWMTGYRINDMECCYKLFTPSMLRAVRPFLSEDRFGVEPQITAALSRLGARLAEVQVKYDPREAIDGKKIGWTDGVRAIYVILRERLGRSPSKHG